MKKRKPKLKIISSNEKPDFSKGGQAVLLEGFAYYNYGYDIKDAQKWVLEWATQKKKDRKTLTAIRQYNFTMTIGKMCKIFMEGYPENQGLLEKIEYAINDAIESYVPKKREKVVSIQDNKKNINIQELMKLRCYEFMGEYIEPEIDQMFINRGKSSFKLSKLLTEHNIPGKWSTIIANVYSLESNDINLLLNPDSNMGEYEQQIHAMLLEAYPYTKTQLKNIQKFYNNLIADLEHHASSKKAVRKKRVKKPPTVEKLISKFQHKKEDQELRLVSEDPAKIIGAKEIWLYNTKYRLLIQAFAEDSDMGGVFTIKGTTIQGVGKSEMKKLRKPKETLTEWKKCGKIKLRKFMDTINAKSKPFTGRMNNDIIILKTVK